MNPAPLPRFTPATDFAAELERRVQDRTAKLMEIVEAQRLELVEGRRSEQVLRANENRWYSIFSHAAVGLCELSLEGKFERVNDELCRLLACTRGDLIASDLLSITQPSDRARAMAAFRRLVETGKPESLDLQYVRRDATVAWVNVQLTRLEDSQGQLAAVLAVSVHYSERKRMELALRKSEAEFRAFFELAALGITQIDVSTGRFLRTNQRFVEMLGYSLKEFRQMTVDQIVHAGDVEEVNRLLEQAAQGTTDEFSLQTRLLCQSGQMLWTTVSASLIRDAHGDPLSCAAIVQDITDRVKAETELRRGQDELELRVQQRTAQLDQANQALRDEIEERKRAEVARDGVLRQLASAQEDERRRISRELHDEVGQHLTALVLGLKTLQSEIRPGARFVLLNELQRITETVGKGVHDLARELRPTALDDLGLLRTVANFVEDWSQRTKIDVDFHSSGLEDVRLPSAIETTLYRIVQESLHNVVKHANASRVSVILERHSNHAVAIVEDNGTGFNAEEKRNSNSGKRLGILGMHERARMVNGEVRIESADGLGTSIFVRLPLSPENPQNQP